MWGKWYWGSGHLKVNLNYYLYYTLLFDEMTTNSSFLTQAEPIFPFYLFIKILRANEGSISVGFVVKNMALKSTSSPITISIPFVQGVANAFQVAQHDLQLNPLDQEVFVVTAVKIDFSQVPRAIAAPSVLSNSSFTTSICKSRPAAMQTIRDSNCIASSRLQGLTAFDANSDVIDTTLLESNAMDSPPSQLDYLDIIATDNFFVAITGENTTVGSEGGVRIFGYRAKADAATYAALVQSEVLSS